MTVDKTRFELNELYNEYKLAFNEEQIVCGEGCISNPLVIVGEAPGKDEISQGRPFVGAAGKNLKEFMDIIGITRESVYITNVIKYRLGKLNEKTNRIINRPATKEDILCNQIWLHRELSLLRPRLIITLGNVPLKAIKDDLKVSIGQFHGTLGTCKIDNNLYKFFALYHPASIIYNRGLKDVYNSDIRLLKDAIIDL